MREDAATKARRILGEGRVILRSLDEPASAVFAEVRGDGLVHVVVHDIVRGWWCSCPARGRCSHQLAVGLVVALGPRKAA
jgi:uncharacterized Zn finger protein